MDVMKVIGLILFEPCIVGLSMEFGSLRSTFFYKYLIFLIYYDVDNIMINLKLNRITGLGSFQCVKTGFVQNVYCSITVDHRLQFK